MVPFGRRHPANLGHQDTLQGNGEAIPAKLPNGWKDEFGRRKGDGGIAAPAAGVAGSGMLGSLEFDG